MTRTALAAAALLAPIVLMSAAPAEAQGAGRWDGFYGGVQIGYGDFDSDGGTAGDADGIVGGVHVGHLWDRGDWVVGVEFSYDFSDADFDGGGSIDEIARLGARLGRDLGRTLVYGTAGIAWADADVGGIGRDETGYFIGGGVDYDVSDRWIVGGRVLYSDFDDLAGPGLDVDGYSVELRASFRF